MNCDRLGAVVLMVSFLCVKCDKAGDVYCGHLFLKCDRLGAVVLVILFGL